MMISKTLTVIVVLLATSTTAMAQAPLPQKPVLAPQVKPAINPIVLRAPVTVVNAATIASGSPNRVEAARRLKAQNVPAAAALSALRGAFGAGPEQEGQALRTAGYATPELLQAIKQSDGLDASAMLLRMRAIGIPLPEWATSLRQLYLLEFDALLALLNPQPTNQQWFGYAADAMGYGPDEVVRTGHRYFTGGFPNPQSVDRPYPQPGDLYSLLNVALPLAQRSRLNHHALFVRMMQAGYPPELVQEQVSYGAYSSDGRSLDAVSGCVRSGNFIVDDPVIPGDSVNPVLRVDILPSGEARHSEPQRRCYVLFLEQLRMHGATTGQATQLANKAVYCLPYTNPGCSVEAARVATLMVEQARFPPEKRGP